MPLYLLQDTCSEERNDRNDGNDAHIANPLLNAVFDDPESDRDNAYERYPPLLHGEAFTCGANALDLEVTISHGQARRAVGHQE